MAQFHWAAVRRLFAPALSRATKLQLLRGVPILSGVPEHALYQLMGVMQLRLVGKLRRLVKPYEPPKNFTLLICGGDGAPAVECLVKAPREFCGRRVGDARGSIHHRARAMLS